MNAILISIFEWKTALGRVLVTAVVGVAMIGVQNAEAQQRSVEQLVQDLAANEFSIRQSATQELFQRGEEALPLLEQVATNGDPETQTRAIAVIARLATEREIHDKAIDILQRMLESDNPNTRWLAEKYSNELHAALHRRALEKLRSLGAKVIDGDDAPFGTELVEIIIPANFRGQREDYKLLNWVAHPLKLTLIGEQIDDELLVSISKTPQMNWLIIKRGVVTQQGAEVIAESFKDLQYLYLYYVPLEQEHFTPITKLTQLTEVRLFGTRIDDEKEPELAAMMPNTKVDVRRGAFLGIYFNDTTGPCVVSNVVQDSAAAQAGLQFGDQVVEFGGEKIETGDQFLKIVGRYFPGDKIEGKVQRGQEIVEMSVTLGRFPDEEIFQ